MSIVEGVFSIFYGILLVACVLLALLLCFAIGAGLYDAFKTWRRKRAKK